MFSSLTPFLSAILAAIVAAKRDNAIKILQAVHTYDPDLYGAAVYFVNWGIKKGEVEALKTATNLDDQMLADALAIIKESAAANGINLS